MKNCLPLTEVIESNQVAQGPRIEEFECAMADYVGVTGGVAVSSGTAALYLALQALGVGPNDEVIMPSYVCAAPWVATTRLGATPIIVDIEPETFSIDPERVKAAITVKTQAIVVPHMFGLPADLKRLRTFGVPLVEDCAQTLGATQAGAHVGTIGDVSICSFLLRNYFVRERAGWCCLITAPFLKRFETVENLMKSYNYRRTVLISK